MHPLLFLFDFWFRSMRSASQNYSAIVSLSELRGKQPVTYCRSTLRRVTANFNHHNIHLLKLLSDVLCGYLIVSHVSVF